MSFAPQSASISRSPLKRPTPNLHVNIPPKIPRVCTNIKAVPPLASVADSASVGCLSPSVQPPSTPLEIATALDYNVEKSSAAALSVVSIGPYRTLAETAHNEKSNAWFKVVDPRKNNDVKLCKVLTPEKANLLAKLTARLNCQRESSEESLLSLHLDKDLSTDSVCAQVLPPGCEIIYDEQKKRRYFVQPNHHGDLHTYVRENKRLHEFESRKIFKQIVQLVALCHAKGIIVRDLKLRKFVFTDKKQTTLRLESFDDVFIVDPTDDTMRTRHGCPAYVAPEILNPGAPMFSGKAADVWSLGVFLFVLLLGRYPFFDETPAGLFSRIRACQFCIPETDLSTEVRFLLRAILRVAPAERPTALELLQHPWVKRNEQKNCCPVTTNSTPIVGVVPC